jgi:hypothetical protein
MDMTSSHACTGKPGYYEYTRRMLQIVGTKLVPINAGNGMYFDGTNHSAIAQKMNPDDGYTVIRACTNDAVALATLPYKLEQTDIKTDVCPDGGKGTVYKTRSYTLWIDGMKSDFTIKLFKNCVALTSEIRTQIAEDSCPEGQIGRIDKTRTYSYFSDGTTKDFSDWVITGNSCVTVPTETVTPYHYEVSCDSYYGAADGSYSGTVMKSGNNVTNAAGVTTFNLISNDTTSCVKTYSDEKEIITEEACPVGQTGTRIMSVVTAENGSGTVYSNGSTPIEKSNTCVTPLDSGSVTNPESETQASVKSAVLSNMSFKLSQLSSNGAELANEINGFDASLATDAHTLNIVADSMTSNNLNAANVSKVVKAFKKASGDNTVNVKVGAVSKNLFDYVGQNGLTVDKISKEKLLLLSSKESDGVVTVEYASYLNKMKPGDKQSFNVRLYNE